VATPAEGGADPYPDSSESDPLQNAGVAARRSADIKLAASIREINYRLSHHRCRMLIPQLAAYGSGTLINQWRDNTLFDRCARAGVGRLPAPPPTWPLLATEFLQDVAWQAAPRFITRSLPKWAPEGGASISSFYINYCYFEFKRHYLPFNRKAWARYRSESLTDFSRPELLNAPALDDPERQAVAQQTYDEMMAAADDLGVRQILELLQEGKPHEQIARELSISVNTVGRRLAAYRRTVKRNGWSDGRNGER
jgi:hypothetical protein